MDTAGERFVCFGPFRVNARSGELFREGRSVHLPPQASKLLLLLVSSAGRLVSREEIQKALWSDDTFVDYEHGINKCVNQIRAALGDDAEEPTYVQTVSRQGYRFLGRVEAEIEPLESAADATVRSRWTWRLAAGLVFVGGIWILTTLAGRKDHDGAGEVSEPEFTQLTSQVGDELFPSFSPSGDFLVYSASTSGQRDIYLRRASGHNAVNLTPDSPLDDWQPAFSPAGDRIAFRSERGGGGIFIMGATGESVRRVTDHGFNPSWSPDGGEIVFSTESTTLSTITNGLGKLGIVRVDTGEVRVLDIEGSAYQPRWSPHGHRIAFWSNTRSARWRDVWTVSPETGDVRPITHDEATDWNPIWSPDGRMIYFTSARNGTASLWRVAVEEKTGATLGSAEFVATSVPADVVHVSLSPDGRRVAYAALQTATNLRKVSFDPTRGAVVGEPVWITRTDKDKYYPAVSPDGRWVAFSLQGAGSTMNIGLVRPDGTDLRMLTTDLRARNFRPNWSPDGSQVVFYSSRDSQKYELWTVRADGSGLRQLTRTPHGIYNPAWSPNGSAIAVRGGQDTYAFDPEATSEGERLRKLSAKPGQSGIFEPTSWSPDGRSLAGTAWNPKSGVAQVAVLALPSEDYRALTAGTYPKWLSDGRRLVFQKDDGIYVLDSESGEYRRILPVAPNITGIDTGIDLSRDGRTIYYVERTIESDIWIHTLRAVR
jgi:Tol biopolymer transport system component/DNA-binding winged helix-turn-helix (wHTH) protein